MEFKKELTATGQLNVIFKYIEKIAKESNLDKTLILCADMGRELIGADRCTVWLRDKKNQTLWAKVAHGIDRIEIPETKGIVGYVVQNKKNLIVNDPYNDPRFNKATDKKTGYKTRNIISLPFHDSEGDIIGAYQAINKITGTGRFSEKDREHLQLASTYAGKQLEAVILQEELQKAQKEIIVTLAETGEIRSKETGQHVKRVVLFSKLLAEVAGFSRSEIDLIGNASPLHDIGKIAIPDSVLLKPGKLTAEEFVIMKRHSSIGYDVLKDNDSKYFQAAASIAYEHHEKWNGKGYPRGIKEKEISHYGRIVAIADVYDALTNKRCYKDAWPLEKVYKIFEEEAGEHFDPALTKLFLKNRHKFEAIKEKFKD